jgi:hypothetical protein
VGDLRLLEWERLSDSKYLSKVQKNGSFFFFSEANFVPKMKSLTFFETFDMMWQLRKSDVKEIFYHTHIKKKN